MSRRTILAPLALALALVACTDVADPNTAPAGPTTPDGLSVIVDLTSGFSNVAVACDGTTAVYVTEDDTRSSSGIAVVPDSPRCVAS